MGLDMFLYADNYFSGYNETEKERTDAILSLANMNELKSDHGSIVVRVEAAYWRKANAIHRWFVDNVQDGKDDCGIYYVSDVTLVELKAVCDRVLANPSLAMDILPPGQGFFFGTYEIDELYLISLKYTSDRIKYLMEVQNSKMDGFIFYYTSSW
jgi:hypothetical protein